jgi:UDP-3-O-[3-hydroxymyristoyl] glucosamine N-acyltransferase
VSCRAGRPARRTLRAMNPAQVRAALADAAIPAEAIGTPPERLEGFSALHEVRPGTVTWSRAADLGWEQMPPCLVIGPPDLREPPPGSGGLRVEDPRYAFVIVAERLGPPPPPPGIAPSARIGAGVTLGEGVVVGEHVVIADGVEIGDGTRLDAGVVIEPGVRIGRRCHVQPGAVIGTPGFGYVRDPDGAHRRFPHLGGVRIEDDVHVGANACIDRGALQDTVIRAGALIDNLVHVGHNDDIGERAVLIAGCVLGGTVRIGADAYIGLGAFVSDQLTIGREAMVGLGAVVVRDVPDGATVFGRASLPMPPGQDPSPSSLRYRP